MALKLTPPQSEQVHALVRRDCCNCDGDNCLLLDDGQEQTCIQLICQHGIYCKYFLSAVLPGDELLYMSILRHNKLIS